MRESLHTATYSGLTHVKEGKGRLGGVPGSCAVLRVSIGQKGSSWAKTGHSRVKVEQKRLSTHISALPSLAGNCPGRVYRQCEHLRFKGASAGG